MVVGIVTLEVRMQGCRSLKDKRRILHALLDRARHDFQVAIAEVGDQELWGNALVCASVPSNDATHAESVLQRVEMLFVAKGDLEVTNCSFDYWRP